MADDRKINRGNRKSMSLGASRLTSESSTTHPLLSSDWLQHSKQRPSSLPSGQSTVCCLHIPRQSKKLYPFPHRRRYIQFLLNKPNNTLLQDFSSRKKATPPSSSSNKTRLVSPQFLTCITPYTPQYEQFFPHYHVQLIFIAFIVLCGFFVSFSGSPLSIINTENNQYTAISQNKRLEHGAESSTTTADELITAKTSTQIPTDTPLGDALDDKYPHIIDQDTSSSAASTSSQSITIDSQGWEGENVSAEKEEFEGDGSFVDVTDSVAEDRESNHHHHSTSSQGIDDYDDVGSVGDDGDGASESFNGVDSIILSGKDQRDESSSSAAAVLDDDTIDGMYEGKGSAFKSGQDWEGENVSGDLHNNENWDEIAHVEEDGKNGRTHVYSNMTDDDYIDDDSTNPFIQEKMIEEELEKKAVMQNVADAEAILADSKGGSFGSRPEEAEKTAAAAVQHVEEKWKEGKYKTEEEEEEEEEVVVDGKSGGKKYNPYDHDDDEHNTDTISARSHNARMAPFNSNNEENDYAAIEQYENAKKKKSMKKKELSSPATAVPRTSTTDDYDEYDSDHIPQQSTVKKNGSNQESKASSAVTAERSKSALLPSAVDGEVRDGKAPKKKEKAEPVGEARTRNIGIGRKYAPGNTNSSNEAKKDKKKKESAAKKSKRQRLFSM